MVLTVTVLYFVLLPRADFNAVLYMRKKSPPMSLAADYNFRTIVYALLYTRTN